MVLTRTKITNILFYAAKVYYLDITGAFCRYHGTSQLTDQPQVNPYANVRLLNAIIQSKSICFCLSLSLLRFATLHSTKRAKGSQRNLNYIYSQNLHLLVECISFVALFTFCLTKNFYHENFTFISNNLCMHNLQHDSSVALRH